jgi:N-acetylmuramoyl-L-alanine amidase
MIAFTLYLLKVTICSAVLYGYYRLTLRNKIFHGWNRFYLLAALVLSITLPLIKIEIVHEPEQTNTQLIQLLNVVNAGDEIIYEAAQEDRFRLSTEQVILYGYALICALMLVLLLRALLQIKKLIRHYPIQAFDDFYFLNTDAKGTPFSFLKYIFWNRQIEISSASGRQILKHELAHVREKHSWDKIFIHSLLIVFWSNPVFWFIRKELAMIHEFIADRKSIDQHDTEAFAAMILQAAYPAHQFALTNNFFKSPIKRRLLMLTKLKNPKASYISRVLALPLLTLLIAAFTLKTKPAGNNKAFKEDMDKPFVAVINAGHGGSDKGAIGEDGTAEKDLDLAIARKIKALNQNKKIKIILTRESDVYHDVKYIAASVAEINPDAFISIHINAAVPGAIENTTGGFEVLISGRNKLSAEKSVALGSLIVNELKKTCVIKEELKRRSEQGVWLLDAPTVKFPSAMITCGYITNKNDLAFIKEEKNQEKIAINILDAIGKLAELRTKNLPASYKDLSDTIKPEKIVVFTEEKFPAPPKKSPGVRQLKDWTDDKIYGVWIDGRRINNNILLKYAPSDFSYYDVSKLTKRATNYGKHYYQVSLFTFKYYNDTYKKPGKGQSEEKKKDEPAKKDVFINENYKSTPAFLNVQSDPVYVLDGKFMGKGAFAKAAIDASLKPEDISAIDVIKGEKAIQLYGENGKDGVISIITKKFEKSPFGTYEGKRITGWMYDDFVNKQPQSVTIYLLNELPVKIPYKEALQKEIAHDYNLDKESNAALPFEKIQTANGEEIFYKADTPPEFPGGDMALYDYIHTKLPYFLKKFEDGKKRLGHCNIRFIINEDGSLSDITALTLADSRQAEALTELITNGPKWEPAVYEGKMVKTAYIIRYTIYGGGFTGFRSFMMKG